MCTYYHESMHMEVIYNIILKLYLGKEKCVHVYTLP